MAANDVVMGQLQIPAGTFGALFSDKGLMRLTFPDEPYGEVEKCANRWLPGARRVEDDGRLRSLRAELVAYFEGRLREFATPVDLYGTSFQQEVWRELQHIGYGETRSYADIAVAIGRPKAVRAVGAANGANPVPLLVPCHRVIGKNGSLTGYAFGLDMKHRLLELEQGRLETRVQAQLSL